MPSIYANFHQKRKKDEKTLLILIVQSLYDVVDGFKFEQMKLKSTLELNDMKNVLCVCSPHVVSVDWMMDCLSQNAHLGEEKYERTDLGLVTPSMR